MQYINNNSDFALDIALKAILPDGAELATAPPNCDFTLTFGTRYDEAKYEVGRYNGEPRGYTVNTDGSLHVIFDAHGLGLGRLGCMLTYGIPDSSYPDGVATVATSYELDVELIGWGADGQQSGTVTIATEAAAVGAAQQAQAAAERAAQAAEASQQAAQNAEDAAQESAAESQASANAAKGSEDAAQASAASSEASRQAAEQAAEQAQQARAAADTAADSAAQASSAAQESKTAAQAAATASAESATAAQNSAESAAAAVTAAQQAIDTANTAAEQATTAAQAANTAADNANTAADNASEYVERYDAIAGALPKVTDTFEGAYDNKGLLYVVRKNKLIAILKDWQVIYVPEGGIALVDAIAPTSFSIGDKVYNVPAGITYVELGLTAPITADDMYAKVLYQNAGIRGFGLYLDGSQNTDLGLTFAQAADLEWLDISGMDTKAVANGLGMCSNSPKLRKIYGKWQLPVAYRADSAFAQCKALEVVDVSEAGMGKCTNLSDMFNGCSSLTSLDVSGWNTGACTNMQGMFNGCSALASLDLSAWDTAACKYMYHMFNGCSSLTSLDVSGWDTSAVTNFFSMLRDCSKLQALDCSNWDVSSANNIESFFRGCKVLKELKTNSFTNSICTGVYCMFFECNALQAIDISGLDPSNVTDAYGAFSGCYALTTLSWPMMGKIKADATNNKTISFSSSPLDRASLDSIFSYDRTANGLTNPLTVQLSAASKALLSAEDIAAITAKGYTIV